MNKIKLTEEQITELYEGALEDAQYLLEDIIDGSDAIKVSSIYGDENFEPVIIESDGSVRGRRK